MAAAEITITPRNVTSVALILVDWKESIVLAAGWKWKIVPPIRLNFLTDTLMGWMFVSYSIFLLCMSTGLVLKPYSYAFVSATRM